VPQNLTEHVPLNAGGKKIFVGGVPTQATDEDLRQYFGMFGAVEHVMLMQDKETGRHRGFGFVTFHDGNIADLVVYIKYHTLYERVMEVKEAQPKGALPKPAVAHNPKGSTVTASLLSSTATNGWGNQLNLASALNLPFAGGSTASSVSSGTSVTPPGVMGNALSYPMSAGLFGSSPTTSALHDLGSQRAALPPHPSSPAAYALHFGNANGLSQSATATTWGSSQPTSNVIGAGRYIPYPTRRPTPASNSSQMGYNNAAAANAAAAAAAHAAVAAVAASAHPLIYSLPQ